ncbi:glycosyltransferase [Cutibacterium namnetense]|mgnify:FL=1|uniref:Glycosyltransferase, group 1 family protein n=2 Tax=Cutibacterium namnetense TaxID=1574624 RepID=F9NVN9_9ACTN|nr:glycosyltransferase [Cutibacterium namnetense]EGR97069.1 glycosyltransferase, group 1 family protein [ [[Propionibacterium] namnetense SK182B-JCVI]REB70301.1 glycosyltransferase family 4 protein [Cutibacterium namnetense]TKW72532.1 MAG: glycosyltransferase family 4 protein [Cutibacterium acnes]
MRVMVLSRGIPSPEAPLRGIFEYDQAVALRQQGHEVVLAVLDARSARHWRKFGTRIEHAVDRNDGITVVRLDVPLGAACARIDHRVHAVAARHLHRIVTSQWGIPDVSHAHFARFAAAAARAGFPEPLVWTEHDSHLAHPDRRLNEDVTAAGNRADAVISVSQGLCDRLAGHGVTSTVVPNIVDVELFDRPDRCHEGTVVVSVATLNPAKGMIELVQAVERLPEVQLRIIGDGPQRRQLEVIAANNPRIVMLGSQPRDRIAEELAGADAFALASHAETFGVACAEALASGLPVLTTACGGPQEFIDDSNGVVVPVGDVDALTEGLDRVLARSWDRDQIAGRARSQFAAGPVVDQLEAVYRKAIANHDGG